MRRNTYQPIVSLLQIAFQQENPVLVDLIAIENHQLLKGLMDDDSLKIFHSCSQDLETLDLMGIFPSTIYDTQIAASFLGFGYMIGYSKLVELSLGVIVSKSQQKSNWMQRPLKDSQIEYAANEVRYLFETFHFLKETLSEKGFYEWSLEESEQIRVDFINNSYSQRLNPAKIKGAGKLSREKLTNLKFLVEWRDEIARTKNIPVRWALSDELLMDLNHSKFETVKLPAEINTDAAMQSLKIAMDKINHIDKDDWLERASNRRPNQEEEVLYTGIDKIVNASSAETGIEPNLIATRKEISILIRTRNFESSKLMNGWRAELLSDDILKILG